VCRHHWHVSNCHEGGVVVVFTATATRNCHCRYVAGHVVLPDPLLPSVEDREAHRPLLYGITNVSRGGRTCVGRVPEDGRAGRSGRLPVDVPPVRNGGRHRRHIAVVVAARQTITTGRGARADWAVEISPSKQAGTDRRRCADPLRGPDPGIPQERVEPHGSVGCHDGLANLPARHHVLWRSRRRQRNAGLRDCHHPRHQSQADGDPTQPAVCPDMDCEWRWLLVAPWTPG